MKKKKSPRPKKLPAVSRDLPPEMVREVLARLPVKSLMKFRCVSKTWLSTIDSPQFIFQHLKFRNNQSQRSRLLVHEFAHEYVGNYCYRFTVRQGDTFEQIVKIPGAYSENHVIHQSCNGLTLIEGPFLYLNDVDRILQLWNPSVRKTLMVYRCPLRYFQPRSTHVISYFMGFVSSSNDFKVLAFSNLGDTDAHDVLEFAIYSLNDDQWSPYAFNDVSEFDFTNLVNRRMVYSGGAIYWLGCDHGEGVDWSDELFSFDFEAEQLTREPLPNAAKGSVVQFIFALGESIALFTMSSESRCRIWAMDRGGSENTWKLWFSGEPNSDACDLLTSVTAPSSSLKILYVQEYNTFLMLETITPHEGEPQDRLMSYNFMSQEIKHLGQAVHGRLSFDTYVESLVFHTGFKDRYLLRAPHMRRWFLGQSD